MIGFVVMTNGSDAIQKGNVSDLVYNGVMVSSLYKI